MKPGENTHSNSRRTMRDNHLIGYRSLRSQSSESERNSAGRNPEGTIHEAII
jgi:hypothetical protein